MFWMQTLTPVERLDKLVLDGTLAVTEDGYTMFCYLCDTHVRTEDAFEDDHEWFHDGARRYLGHVNECRKRCTSDHGG